MKVSFLQLKGLLEFLRLGELDIGKTFGPVGFIVLPYSQRIYKSTKSDSTDISGQFF